MIQHFAAIVTLFFFNVKFLLTLSCSPLIFQMANDQSKPLDTKAGQAVYNPFVLSIYDFWVLTVSARYAWRCPTSRILSFYNEHITATHLDIGVGTGWLLNKASFPNAPEIWLLDLNKNSLDNTAKRIARYKPKTVLGDIVQPMNDELPERYFDSIAMNYLFHCVPGPFHRKGVAFEYVAALLKKNGTLFGSTILGEGVKHNAFGRLLMKFYNKKGIFGNEEDSAEGLTMALQNAFHEVDVKVVGKVALFKARNPR